MEEELVVTRLGWAGLQLEAGGQRLVIDLFENRHAFEPFMEVKGELPGPSGPVDVALVTHLHADHADPAALSRAMTEGAKLYRPASAPGDDLDRYSTSAAETGIAEAGIDAVIVEPWQTFDEGPFTVTAVPATDGFGDPQVSWVVEAAGRRIFHGGDTMFHGAWFPIASRFKPFDAAFLPINGPKCNFPHRQPASPFPVALDPTQAAAAAAMLGAELAVPIHYEGIDVPGIYEPVEEPAAAFEAEAAERGTAVRLLGVGQSLPWS
jgi:L-ascorbate metabolism protein UlaG (beta-lactamase superfamily)